jgi:hypothetical protein
MRIQNWGNQCKVSFSGPYGNCHGSDKKVEGEKIKRNKMRRSKMHCERRVFRSWCWIGCGESGQDHLSSKHFMSARDVPEISLGLVDTRINRENLKTP